MTERGKDLLWCVALKKTLSSTSFCYRQQFQHLPCLSALIWTSWTPSVLKALFSGPYPILNSLTWTKWNLCIVFGRSFTTAKLHLANRGTALSVLKIHSNIDKLSENRENMLKCSQNEKHSIWILVKPILLWVPIEIFIIGFFFLAWRSLGLKSCRIWFSTGILPKWVQILVSLSRLALH